ncbi:Myb/SANT-like DNA-binding domain-containing protein [Xylariales sp. PMI_506]|nr:Myb/SANT-like DNA-binding domain-containing protein [Xylariales sp. PMI_506]
MSDEDGTPGSANRRNADRRTPRFSWNHAYEATFFRSLCESIQLGLKENHSFKAGAWERAAIALRDKHTAYPEKSHLINKADNARKKFRMWRGLREDPEFLYNPSTRMVTASEEAWARHFEKEPLSKALRGRPFDHEEYMEILFPDVIGSGGAPKRIMKKRKGPDGNPIVSDESSNPGQAVMDLTLDSSLYSQTPTPHQHQPSQPPPPTLSQQQQGQPRSSHPPHPPRHASQIPTPSPVPPTQPISHPTSAIIPPRTSILSTSALTPPDETPNPTNSRKRFSQDATDKRRGRPSRFTSNIFTSGNGNGNGNSSGGSGGGGSGGGNGSSSSSSTPSGAATALQSMQQQQQPTSSVRAQPIHSSFNTAAFIEDGLHVLAEALKTRNPPRWPEQAMEIFFRDFADEDPDLQLKIAEKALTDENKAMVFVKSTPELRRHWVGRLRDVHLRGLGLGRIGEEAS